MELQILGNVIEARMTNYPYKIFQTTFPEHFKMPGFKSINVIQTLTPLIVNGDYTMHMKDSELDITFTINNTKKNIAYTLHFRETYKSINIENIPAESMRYFMALQNRIAHLETKLEEIKNDLDIVQSHNKKYDNSW